MPDKTDVRIILVTILIMGFVLWCFHFTWDNECSCRYEGNTVKRLDRIEQKLNKVIEHDQKRNR